MILNNQPISLKWVLTFLKLELEEKKTLERTRPNSNKNILLLKNTLQ